MSFPKEIGYHCIECQEKPRAPRSLRCEECNERKKLAESLTPDEQHLALLRNTRKSY